MPPSPVEPDKNPYCISYAPFRGHQSPFGPDVLIDPRQIDSDLVQLKAITNCVRTYSIDHGLDPTPCSDHSCQSCVLQPDGAP